MTYRLLQLNIQKGRYLPAVIGYIQKGNFDIVCLQEVAGGNFAYNKKNCYEELIGQTGMSGELVPYINVAGDLTSYTGLATLYQKPWHQVANHIVWMKRYTEVTTAQELKGRTPRCAEVTILKRNGTSLMVVNTHLAWGPTPTDTVYKKNQAEKLYRWIKAHRKSPMILAGDFNLNPQTKIVTKLGSLGVNLTKKYTVTNTLNPRTHYAKNLFPSGLPVDYVIADKRLVIKKFFVEKKVDLSDHFGLVTEFSL